MSYNTPRATLIRSANAAYVDLDRLRALLGLPEGWDDPPVDSPDVDSPGAQEDLRIALQVEGVLRHLEMLIFRMDPRHRQMSKDYRSARAHAWIEWAAQNAGRDSGGKATVKQAQDWLDAKGTGRPDLATIRRVLKRSDRLKKNPPGRPRKKPAAK
jgi:hypothetical protein